MKQNRVHGLMVGITIGFAFWGSVQAEPQLLRRERLDVIQVGTGVISCEEENLSVGRNTEEGIVADELKRENGGIGQGEKEKKEIGLHALSAVLMDGETGRVLYEKEGDVFRPMASTTKIMTCILALENGNPEDICVVSETAAAQPKVHLGARKGTQFYLKDLLYSLMLESHNDTAVVIAEHVGGSVEGFSSMMNQKARDLGCKKTCFLTPNGLDQSYTAADGKEYTHGTTAKELAMVMRYCVMSSPKREDFLRITSTPDYSFGDVEGRRSFFCVNHNVLLSAMDGLLSGKTGFTNGAGYSYVAALEDEGRTYILAILGSGWPPHKTYKWADARALFDYGKERFCYRDVYEEPDLGEILVKDGIGEKRGKEDRLTGPEAVVKPVSGIDEKDRHLRILIAEDEKVEQKVELPEYLKAPVAKGELIGHVRYLLDGKPIRSYPLYADRDVKKKDFWYYASQMGRGFLLKMEKRR